MQVTFVLTHPNLWAILEFLLLDEQQMHEYALIMLQVMISLIHPNQTAYPKFLFLLRFGCCVIIGHGHYIVISRDQSSWGLCAGGSKGYAGLQCCDITARYLFVSL